MCGPEQDLKLLSLFAFFSFRIMKRKVDLTVERRRDMKKVIFWSVTTVVGMFGIYFVNYKIGEFLGIKLTDAILEMGGEE